ncbi:MAG: hypothetical protein ED556_04585 [Winogradskyella sp.]|uniref:hypothetical protein n=1 Tax=Winogradskyella sp. TaxID=1883156 RepID=UPI000F407E73|nr:hypothetical protein [Winogradskyella sp.]RNC86701.1 MAG: hypothetical protein ED556_04585 [Winogradskyella sp.]
MRIKHIITQLFSLVIVFALNTVIAQEDSKSTTQDFELEVQSEYRYFTDSPQFQGQKDHFPSIAIIPEYNIEWNKGYESINFTGFFRLDRDDNRTHWDIRELYYQKAANNWEFSAGLKKIFWGVTESNHLVDIINQTDAVESFDGEAKLGQPMLQFTLTTDYGNFDFIYMPFHRKRVFPGERGRLRFPTVIDENDIGYESGAEEWRQDVAFRWSHYIGAFDIGISHFYGNGREPLFTFDPNGQINAFYPVINQIGLDLQATHNAFLWKFESIYRSADAQDFFALTAGLEYTFSNIDGNGLDIGLLGEYLYDDRDELALNALQNDFFFGSRIALNDTQDTSILVGGIADLESSSKIFSIEASRRIGSSWKAELEARIFSSIDQSEFILSNFSQDSFLRFTLSKFF